MSLEHLKSVFYGGQLTLVEAFWLLLVSFVLGAVHALGPGHGKSLLAAYLLGGRGQMRDVLLMAFSLTFSHVASVVAVGLATVWLANAFWPETATKWLSFGAGLGIFGIGLWLLRARALELLQSKVSSNVTEMAGMQVHSHGTDRKHEHHVGHQHRHRHFDESTSWLSALWLGVTGGLVPCPKAIVILLLAVSLHRLTLGLAVIAAFSLGIAATLVALGLSVVWLGEVALDRLGKRWVSILPVGGALLIVALGLVLTVRTLVIL